jgi:hypothetical protein
MPVGIGERLMATQNLEAVSGLVEQINAKGTGIKVAGEWLNVSAYHAIAELPELGQRVDVQVERTDRGVWIQSVEILDGGQIHQLPQAPRRGGGGGRSLAEQRDIRRLSVLKAAAAFCAARPEVKSSEVVQLADRWLAWFEQPERKGGEQAS